MIAKAADQREIGYPEMAPYLEHAVIASVDDALQENTAGTESGGKQLSSERALGWPGRPPNSFQQQLNALRMEAVDAVALPVLAVMGDGQLVFANRAGKVTLRTGRWLRQQGERVAGGAHLCERHCLVRALAEFRNGRSTSMLLTDRMSSQQAVMTTAPLRSTAMPSGYLGLIWLVPTTPPPAPLRELAHAFGLTNAERRLLQQLVAGEELREAAQKLHISVHTARSHLKSIFRRTGRRSQGQLLALANRMATMDALARVTQVGDACPGGTLRIISDVGPSGANILTRGGRE